MARNNKDKIIPAPKENKGPVNALSSGPHRVGRHIEHREEFTGPIPSPEVFRQYGEVVHDAPERILKVFEQDSQHRREMQKLSLISETNRDSRAQWMAFVIMVVALGVTAASVIYGRNVAPGIISGLATLFLALRVLFVGKKKEPKAPDSTDK